MNNHYDIIIIGAGPAGMSASCLASKYKVKILVLDVAISPGGQIFRAVETNQSSHKQKFGTNYLNGIKLVNKFRKCSIDYQSRAKVWHLSENGEVHYLKDNKTHFVKAKHILITTGAQERPFPVTGWTLNGVMTAGAAQILLKESNLGIQNAVFVGTGPLLYLIAHQYLMMDIPIKAVIDTTPLSNYFRAIPKIVGLRGNFNEIYKGIKWIGDIKKSNTFFINRISDLRILGDEEVNAIEYQKNGQWNKIECEHVLLHQGLVPEINISLSVGCRKIWNQQQACWNIDVDKWFQSSLPCISVAGDASSISGAVAAEASGKIAALNILAKLNIITAKNRDQLAIPIHKSLKTEMSIRTFLETLFNPISRFRIPNNNDTIVCRCEEVSAGEIRESVDLGSKGPNQTKSFTRCGMGPCQGRLCGLTVSEIIADQLNCSIEEVGYYRIRPPVTPITLGELSATKITKPTVTRSN